MKEYILRHSLYVPEGPLRDSFLASGVFQERTTRVVHCKRSAYDVFIGRPSIWGNPFVVGVDGSRSEVIGKYREWIRMQPRLLSRLPELKGKTLGCWCAPQMCHGDVLAELAEAV